MTRLCLFYAAGPGDLVRTFEQWACGQDDIYQPGLTYSGQFFDLCKRLNARGIAVSSCPRSARVERDQFTVINLPKPKHSGGLSYHLAQVRYMLRIFRMAKNQGADYLILSDATGHWFPMTLWPRRPAVIASFHCTLWPPWSAMGRIQSWLNRLNGRALKRRARGALCISPQVAEQVEAITGPAVPTVFGFGPTYRQSFFKDLAPPKPNRPFRVLFAGRIEEDKGVLDAVTAFKYLAEDGRRDICLDICGDGSQAREVQRRIADYGLEQTVRFHGFCRHDEYRRLIEDSHLFIVPTATSFNEGFNKVVAEAVLSGRPVLTTKACPAMFQVRGAAVEIEPSAPQAWVGRIAQLADHRAEYAELRAACSRYQAGFYDLQRSWGHALYRALVQCQPGLSGQWET